MGWWPPARAALLAAALTLADPGALRAQADRSGLWVEAPVHRQAAADLARQAAFAVRPTCRVDGPARRIGYQVQVPPAMEAGASHPSRGRWAERWSVRRCAEDVLITLFFSADRDGIDVAIGVPGRTRCPAALQAAVTSAMTSFLREDLAECPSVLVIDAAPDGGGGAAPEDTKAGPWVERWRLGGCGREQVVRVRFGATFGEDGEEPPVASFQILP